MEKQNFFLSISEISLCWAFSQITGIRSGYFLMIRSASFLRLSVHCKCERKNSISIRKCGSPLMRSKSTKYVKSMKLVIRCIEIHNEWTEGEHVPNGCSFLKDDVDIVDENCLSVCPVIGGRFANC